MQRRTRTESDDRSGVFAYMSLLQRLITIGILRQMWAPVDTKAK